MKNDFKKIIDNLESIFCSILVCWLVILLFIQVIARYFFGSSISWAEEISRFSLMALVYISASIGIKDNKHIRITAHLKYLPSFIQMILRVLSESIWFVFNIFVIYLSSNLIISMAERPLISGALMLDMRYVFAIIPIAFFIQTIRLVQRWYLDIKGWKSARTKGVMN